MNRTWELEGIVFLDKNQKYAGMHRKKFIVRYTSDNIGKSLSIADERSGVMFQIPFDSIYEQIQEAKNETN